MSILKTILFTAALLVAWSFSLYAGFEDNYGWGVGAPSVRYCQWNECWLQQGTQIIRNSLSDIETDRSFSQYIQDIVAYLLTFLALIAVIYIIYAGFNIMIWNGDEEKLKKSRQTIIYVAIWLVVIFLAWPITLFILNILNVS